MLLSINAILVISANEKKKKKKKKIVEISISEWLGTPHSPYSIRKFLSFGEPPFLPLPELDMFWFLKQMRPWDSYLNFKTCYKSSIKNYLQGFC